MPQQPDKEGNKGPSLFRLLPLYCFAPTSPSSRRNVTPRSLCIKVHSRHVCRLKKKDRGDSIWIQNTGEGIYRKDVKWHTHRHTQTHTLEQKQTCTRAKAFPGSCSLARTRIVTPPRNASVPLSGFWKMLYVYLMLPAQRRVLGSALFEDTQSHFGGGGTDNSHRSETSCRWLRLVKRRKKEKKSPPEWPPGILMKL